MVKPDLKVMILAGGLTPTSSCIFSHYPMLLLSSGLVLSILIVSEVTVYIE